MNKIIADLKSIIEDQCCDEYCDSSTQGRDACDCWKSYIREVIDKYMEKNDYIVKSIASMPGEDDGDWIDTVSKGCDGAAEAARSAVEIWCGDGVNLEGGMWVKVKPVDGGDWKNVHVKWAPGLVFKSYIQPKD